MRVAEARKARWRSARKAWWWGMMGDVVFTCCPEAMGRFMVIDPRGEVASVRTCQTCGAEYRVRVVVERMEAEP